MKRYTLSHKTFFVIVLAAGLVAVAFFPHLSLGKSEARFTLKQITSPGGAPLFAPGEYALPFQSIVVSEGRYCGLEISFLETRSKTEQLVLLFDLPCTDQLSVREKWNAQKRERTLESQIKQIPLTLTAQNLTVPNEDAPLNAIKRTWSPKFYLERKIFDSTGRSRSERIDFGEMTLTIKTFSVQGQRISMQFDFTGRVKEDRATYTKGIYEIQGSFEIKSDQEIGLRMTD